MNTYLAIYRGKRIEVQADSSYAAQLKAAKILGAKKSYEVNIALLAVGNREVVHVAVD